MPVFGHSRARDREKTVIEILAMGELFTLLSQEQEPAPGMGNIGPLEMEEDASSYAKEAGAAGSRNSGERR